MLSGLRYFERPIKDNQLNQNPINKNNKKPSSISTSYTKEAYSWGKVDMASMAKCLILICKHVYEIISLEDRLLQIQAPCYILGININNYLYLINIRYKTNNFFLFLIF